MLLFVVRLRVILAAARSRLPVRRQSASCPIPCRPGVFQDVRRRGGRAGDGTLARRDVVVSPCREHHVGWQLDSGGRNLPT